MSWALICQSAIPDMGCSGLIACSADLLAIAEECGVEVLNVFPVDPEATPGYYLWEGRIEPDGQIKGGARVCGPEEEWQWIDKHGEQA